jgi:hypothetical protein
MHYLRRLRGGRAALAFALQRRCTLTPLTRERVRSAHKPTQVYRSGLTFPVQTAPRCPFHALGAQINVAGGIVLRVDEARLKKPFGGQVMVTGRTLYFHADDQATLDAWLAALTAAATAARPALDITAVGGAAGGSAPASSVGSASTATAGRADTGTGAATPVMTPVAGSSGGDSFALGGAAALPPLPDTIDIDGPPETGTELRVRAPAGLLDSLCVAWFRFTGDALPPADSDIGVAPGTKYCLGATAQTYTVTDADVGKRLGCAVRAAGGLRCRWTVMNDPVVPVDLTTVSVRLQLAPHEHSKYCDRRVRVCTAGGRYREGEVLRAVLRGPAAEFGKYRVAWYRSDVVDESSLVDKRPGAPPPPADAALALTATAGGTLPGRAGRTASVLAGDAAAGTDAAVSAAGRQSVNLSRAADLARLEFYRVAARPVADLPPAPPDHAPSPSIAEIRARTLSMRAPGPPSQLGVSGAAYPLFRADVGRMVMCALVPADAVPPATLHPLSLTRGLSFGAGLGAPAAAGGSQRRRSFMVSMGLSSRRPSKAGDAGEATAAAALPSLAVGPVEAAPPKAREIWIEGVPAVGNLLVGNVYYYGGYEGWSEVSWVAINEEGDTVEVRPPTACDPDAPLPDIDAPIGSPADSHPRALRLTEELRGCLLKFKVRPVRSDGDEGHTESSRPTVEVAPESESARRAAVAAAADVRAARAAAGL